MRRPHPGRLLLVAIILLVTAIPAAPRLSPSRNEETGAVSAPSAAVADSTRDASGVPRRRGEEGGEEQRGLSQVALWTSKTGAADSGKTSSQRDYLNGLAADSSALSDRQLSNIAFVKTHKTASTTLAYLLFRYARRHDVKLAYFKGHNSAISLREALTQTEAGKGRVDIMHYHMSVFGQFDGSWQQAENYYKQILREEERVNFITVLREPRKHLLSYYYYFIQPQTQQSIQDFLMRSKHRNDKFHQRLRNPLSAEFGVKNEEQLKHFVDWSLPNFKLVILTEQFDEGLMVLRRLLGWQMIDMTYCSMYETKKGATRYDGKPLVNVPHFEDLPYAVQEKIDGITRLDRMLYFAGQEEYEKRRNTMASHLDDDVAGFRELQSIVTTYLDSNTSSLANRMYKTENVYASERDSPLYHF